MLKLPTITVVNHHHCHFGDSEYIGRGSPLGNPYSHKDGTKALYRVETREDAIEAYRAYLEEAILQGNQRIIQELDRLAYIAMEEGSLTLRCYCAPKPCHGDVIREVLLTAIKGVLQP